MHTVFSEKLHRAIAVVNDHLAFRTFLVNEHITLADLTVAAITQTNVAWILDPELRKKYGNIVRHMETVVNNPKLKAIFGETTYCDKPMQYAAPAKEKKEPKPAAPKAEKKPKPKEKEEDEEDEPSVPAEPKVKNPLDDLPKSNFNLEDWKRAYSNKDTRGADGAIEWFYQKYVSLSLHGDRLDLTLNYQLR